MGEIVCANVRLVDDVDEDAFIGELKSYCAQKMGKHKVPVRITISDEKLHSHRFKKVAGLSNKG